MLSQDYFEKQSSADEMKLTKGIRASKRRFRMAMGLAAFLASVTILHTGVIPAYAEEAEDVAEETITIEQPEGSASVVEVIKDQSGTETNTLTTSTDPVAEHVNDMPSITVTETFSKDPHTDPGLTPDSISVTLTDGGDAVAPECMADALENSSGRTDKITKVDTPADTEAGTPATTTWTKVTVTESQNAIQKAIDDALSRVTDQSIKSITITVADGEYDGDVTISSDKVAAGKLSDDFTLYILSEGSHAPADESTKIINKETINAAAETGVHVNGAIIINNISTVLAGLYFSKGRTIDVTGTDKNKIEVFGTKGNDNISLNIKGDVKNAKVDSGAGDDTIGFVQTSGKINTNIETGAGEDYVSASTASTVDDQDGTLKINTADGDDVIQIDTSLANAIGSVNIIAGAGDDTLDLIGILADTDNRISKNTNQIILFNDSTKKLVINGIPNIETFTDSLENKKTQNITSLSASGIQSFTNYRYTGSFDDALTANWTQTNLFLTKLIIEGDGKDVKIGDLNVPRANLVIKAKELTISGTITALDIKINAIDTDDLYKLNTTEFEQMTGQTVGENGELSGSFMDFYSKAVVTVEENAKLIAKVGSISIEATTSQTHDLLDLFGQTGIDDDLNFLNIKVGESGINLKGALEASRNIILKAAATVMIDVSNDMLASLFIPLAFGLAVSDVHIDIESAKLKSGGDITADATSDINVKGEASTGKLPVAIALSIGVSDTHIKVAGDSVLNAGGNVELNADLKLQTEASSKKGDMEGTSGGFIAVEIGVTDSYVKVTDN
ncbi:MAG: hypothetical protein J5525_08430, partial [Lachnospiraceae bacterium]|nr:hypothetical protein [Lachnospiraceae bacterium]